MLIRPRFLVELLGLAILMFGVGVAAAVKGDKAPSAPSLQYARIVQGQFDSSADQASFQQTLAKAFGGEVKIENPGADPVNGDGAEFDNFGISVAVADDTALVGAFLDDIGANSNQGAVYVFTRNGSAWSQQTKLTASDGAANKYFGNSVALAGNTALVGAVRDNFDQGSAYVFTRAGTVWSQQAKLSASDGAFNENFGSSVALDGDTALVGAFADRIGTNSSQGSAYVFTRSGTVWSEQAKLSASDGATSDYFGNSVALAGDTALVGAVFDDVGANVNQGSAYVFTLSGALWSQQAKLTATDGATFEEFGRSVALAGDTALVGANGGDIGGNTDQGSAYVFTRSGMDWSQQAKLTASDGAAGDQFGYAVAIAGNTALVGAVRDNAEQGSAYVFTRSGVLWSEQTKLTASDGAADDSLGSSVALADDFALVGAYADDISANVNQGSAHVFTRSGTDWSHQAQLTAGDGAAGDLFGNRIALAGDTALVGVPSDDLGPNAGQGSAYLFSRSGELWSLQAKLIAADGAAGDGFGVSVAIAGDTALVGAGSDDIGNADQGSAYVFVRNGIAWSQQAKLTAIDGAAGDNFGNAVALSGDTALIGSMNDQSGANVRPGSAYVFMRSGTDWSQQAKLTASDAETNDAFGASVALSGDTALVGAFADDIGVNGNQGSAYVFTRSDALWTQQAKLSADNGTASDHFGVSVALAGDSALVGAYFDSVNTNSQQGSAYVFTRSGTLWSQQAQLFAGDGAADDYFGHSVALLGDIALVGAYQDGIGANVEQGSAYVFIRSGGLWTERAKLTASDGSAGDRFGLSVALAENIALIGAPNSDSTGPYGNPSVGSVYAGKIAFADVQIAKTNNRNGLLDGEQTVYAIVVANAGPNSVAGATLTDTLPNTLLSGSWMCVPASSTATCPTPSAGAGNLIAQIDLGVNQYLRFDVIAEVNGSIGAFVTNTATVSAPPGTTALNTSDDSATDQDPIVPIGVFSDSFETAPSMLSVPGANEALRMD